MLLSIQLHQSGHQTPFLNNESHTASMVFHTHAQTNSFLPFSAWIESNQTPKPGIPTAITYIHAALFRRHSLRLS